MSNMFSLISHVILFYHEITSNYNGMQVRGRFPDGGRVSASIVALNSLCTDDILLWSSVADVVCPFDFDDAVLTVPVDLVILGLYRGVLAVVQTRALHAKQKSNGQGDHSPHTRLRSLGARAL